jgi:long-subunit acyl-CoA synthetase (AMP-forming)
VTPAEFSADAGVRALIEAHIETVNADLAQVETIKRFSVLPHPFALERGEGTVL